MINVIWLKTIDVVAIYLFIRNIYMLLTKRFSNKNVEL